MIRGERKLVSPPPSKKLTALEQAVLTLFARGGSYVQIAQARGNSTVTVRNTIYRIQDKLGIKTKQELVIWGCAQWPARQLRCGPMNHCNLHRVLTRDHLPRQVRAT